MAYRIALISYTSTSGRVGSRITHTLTMTSNSRSTQVARDHMCSCASHPFWFRQRALMRKRTVFIGQQICARWKEAHAPPDCRAPWPWRVHQSAVSRPLMIWNVHVGVVGLVERKRPLVHKRESRSCLLEAPRQCHKVKFEETS